MYVLAALGDAPTAAIAIIATLLGIFVVVRGRRGERAGTEKPAPSLLAVPLAASGAGGEEEDDGLQRMAVHDIGHGTIRLGGVASPNTEPEPAAPALPPRLPPLAVAPAPEPERQVPESQPEAVPPVPGPVAPAPEPEAAPAGTEPAAPPPAPEPPAWMALRPPPPAAVPPAWFASQPSLPLEPAAPAPESPPWTPAPAPAAEPEPQPVPAGRFSPARIRRRKKPPGA